MKYATVQLEALFALKARRLGYDIDEAIEKELDRIFEQKHLKSLAIEQEKERLRKEEVLKESLKIPYDPRLDGRRDGVYVPRPK